MGVLDWSFVSLLSAALLFLFFSVCCLFSFVWTRRSYQPLKKRRPPKNKKKRKRFLRMLGELERRWKRQRTQAVVLLLLAGSAGGGAFYTRYYQQHHLQGDDAQAVAQSYYLLDELTTQLASFQTGENPKKTIKNIQELSGRLSSYGARNPSMALSAANQKTLSQYYVKLQELGVNLNGQTELTLQNASAIEGYQTDIEKAKTSQSKVFKQFNINESALKNRQ